MSAADNPKLAVLIDADNASSSLVKELLEEVAKFGTATVKRAYGDWTGQQLAGWKEHLNRHAIQPIQQFAYTKGKNSTDASLIIDAMDLLYADNVDGFCLVSSDSDFTRLATRLRESRKVVYGLGERKTPEAFRAACDRFVFFEVLKRGVASASSVEAGVAEVASIADVPDLEQSLRRAFDAVSRDNGWATLSSVGSYMAKNNPSFDTRLYGFRKLSDMVRRQPFIEIQESVDGSSGPLLVLRLKPRAEAAAPGRRTRSRGRGDAASRTAADANEAGPVSTSASSAALQTAPSTVPSTAPSTTRQAASPTDASHETGHADEPADGGGGGGGRDAPVAPAAKRSRRKRG